MVTIIRPIGNTLEIVTVRSYDGFYFNTFHQFTRIGDRIDFSIERTGNDARQVELDNRYSG